MGRFCPFPPIRASRAAGCRHYELAGNYASKSFCRFLYTGSHISKLFRAFLYTGKRNSELFPVFPYAGKRIPKSFCRFLYAGKRVSKRFRRFPRTGNRISRLFAAFLPIRASRAADCRPCEKAEGRISILFTVLPRAGNAARARGRYENL